MKFVRWVCLFILILLSGCANSGTPLVDETTWQPKIDSFDVKQELHLQECQDYEIFDYQDDTVLILISDRSKQNPFDINDQVNTTFYENFVLFDLSSKAVKEIFPIQKFGICNSALSFLEGVVFSFFEVTSDSRLSCSINFIDDSGMQCIYNDHFSPFVMGPVMQHFDNAVLFSYLTSEEDTFGVMKITEALKLEPVLSFSAEEFDYISDDFKASKASYCYTIGDAGKVTFCVGTSAGTTTRISLPEGRKIHSFDVTEETLIVSLAANETDSAGIQIFNLNTGEPISEPIDSLSPLYSISVNEYEQMCGISDFTLKLFTLQDQIEEIVVDTSTVSGDFFKILSDEKNFLVANYGFDKNPEFWVVFSND